MSKGKIAVGAVFGAVAGFVSGILLAPKSGKETREDIKKASVETKDAVVENVEKTKAAAEKKAREARVVAEKKVKEAKAWGEEVVADVNERAADLKNRTERAVEGAKKGFADEKADSKKKK